MATIFEDFYTSLDKIIQEQGLTVSQKDKLLYTLFVEIVEEITKPEGILFTTLFSRLVYVCTTYQISKLDTHYCHLYRKSHEKTTISKEETIAYTALGEYVICALLKPLVLDIDFHKHDLPEAYKGRFAPQKREAVGFKRSINALLIGINTNSKELHFYDEEDPTVQKKALYDIHDKNEHFNQNIQSILKSFSLPLVVNLLDVDVLENGDHVPSAFVIKPDYLIDVTSIAECCKAYGAEPLLHLINRYKPQESTVSLLLGNIVNQILDLLVHDPQANLDVLVPEILSTHPLGLSLLDDEQVRSLLVNLKMHFVNIKQVVNNEFKNLEIARENLYLEPAFLSRDFGIQGRLDILHHERAKRKTKIIELKSGSVFMPNAYGINPSHYVQTLLYEMMIHSTYEARYNNFNYILYSKQSDKTLRLSPVIKAKQHEAIMVRNDLIAIDQMVQSSEGNADLFGYIKVDNFPQVKGFQKEDIMHFHNVYVSLSEIEKEYFRIFSAFIAREQSIAKTGEHGNDRPKGHASLWLDSWEDKKDRFSIIYDLKIIHNASTEEEPYILLQRNQHEYVLANFREGDLGILYPYTTTDSASILKEQILKCTIVSITMETIEVRLRNKQYNQSLFKDNTLWAIEPDSLDTGFNNMYKGLFAWACADPAYRQKILGIQPPGNSQKILELQFDEKVTAYQVSVLQKIITAEDYFLLWGPPGTGKTTVILKKLVEYYFTQTSQNILLLAYTNKAVDEICDALQAISPTFTNHFMRLGSRISSNTQVDVRLFEQVIKGKETRQQILDIITKNRIYVSTIASMSSKTDLFRLQEFDTIIIDEASQILEPMLCGLLQRAKKWILIGDHKQLPAVVVQSQDKTTISSPKLNAIGFTDTRMSLFERLYFQMVRNNWDHNYTILSEQGRMHNDIMALVNKNYYNDNLTLLPGLERQVRASFWKDESNLSKLLQHRLVYVDTPIAPNFVTKTNIFEAEVCAKIARDIIATYKRSNKEFTYDSIGIITPYRAQIATIKHTLEEIGVAEMDKITIDTVERYQGSSRDFIILSCCVNKVGQFANLVSLSIEGIDRKLNVALTRAREQIIVIGNEKLLSHNESYNSLLSNCYKVDIDKLE